MLNLITLRNRHFLTVVSALIDSIPAGKPVDIDAIAAKVALSPAPAYYCTYDYALRVLRVLRHGRLTLRRDRRFELWTELNARVSRLMARRGVRLPEALANVLADGGASQFFISPATASTLARRYYLPSERRILIPA